MSPAGSPRLSGRPAFDINSSLFLGFLIQCDDFAGKRGLSAAPPFLALHFETVQQSGSEEKHDSAECIKSGTRSASVREFLAEIIGYKDRVDTLRSIIAYIVLCEAVPAAGPYAVLVDSDL